MSLVAVTGSSGFIGRRLVNMLGNRAVPLVRSKCSLSDRSRLICYEDRASVCDALKGVETVVALGGLAHQPKGVAASAMFLANSIQPMILATAAGELGVKRYIYISSIKVFGTQKPGTVFTDETPLNPCCIYGASKAQAEVKLCALSDQCQLEVTVLRPPLVYGPGVKGNLALLADLVKRGLPLPFAGMTTNRRTLVSLDDLCRAILIAADGHVGKGRFIVCDDISLSTREIVEVLARCSKRPPLLFHFPESIIRGACSVLGRESVAEALFDSLECVATGLKAASDWRPERDPRRDLCEALFAGEIDAVA